MAFVHLHNHSQYSLLDGATRVEDMARRANELEMGAVALTDHGYMYGIPAFYDACHKYDVKPIIGCEVYFTTDNTLSRDKGRETYHMILLAKDKTGYQNLIKIVSRAAVEGFYYKPRVTFDHLREHAEGLIGTSACVAGIIPSKLLIQQATEAESWAARFAEIFAPGDFYIELQNQGLSFSSQDLNRSVDLQESGLTLANSMDQTQLNRELSEVARRVGLKTIATNDIHYLLRPDAVTQDILLCVGTASRFDDPNRMRFSNDQFYMKDEAEMRAAMVGFEEACDNTVEVAEKCQGDLLSHDYILPTVPLPAGETNETMLRKEVEKGLKKLYGDPYPDNVGELFEHEYDVICATGFAGYFLVVQEFVNWAREHGVGVGPGRGSAAGSLVAHALGITALDPIENELIFERFLTRERPEMPDIDIDFDDAGRADVIEHLRQLYGPDSVAHVITFNSLKAKAAIVDTTRVFDYPINVGSRISKMIPFNPKAELKAVLGIHEKDELNKEQRNPDLVKAYETEADTKRIVDAAMTLEGSIRGEGIHASAVIICPDPVDNHVPVKYDIKGDMIITQYDGSYNAKLGLLKMDFLGLRTLNVLKNARKYVYDNYSRDVDPDTLPLDDSKTYDLLSRGDTSGLFQVESSGMTSLVRRMNVSKFQDVVASIALYRPGPLNSGMTSDFVTRKNDPSKISYYDERLIPILKETYGTIVYQEQVMRISMTMSGFTAGESDLLRKAMGKKNIAMMKVDMWDWQDGSCETMQDHWLNGAEKHGYSRQLAQRIWDDVEKFAEYAFNKSHSAAYAILVMRTAWFKTYYPREYMAAVLTSFMGKSERLIQYITACKNSGIEVLPPDINSSKTEFTPLSEDIRFGLEGVKGVGEAAAAAIIAEREAHGNYANLHDFIRRVDNTLANKRTVEALVKAGAFDSTGYTRRQLMRFIEMDKCMETAAQYHRDMAAGQTSLFDGLAADDAAEIDSAPAPDGVEWDQRTRLTFEKEVMGMYVSDHPLRPYEKLLQESSDYPLSVFMADASEDEMEGNEDGLLAEEMNQEQNAVPQGKLIRLAGMLSQLKPMVSKKGDRMARFKLEDMGGSIDCIIFPTYYADYGSLLADEAIVSCTGRYDATDRGAQFLVNRVYELDLGQADNSPSQMELRLKSEAFNQTLSDAIARILKDYPGRDGVALILARSDGGHTRAQLPLSVNAGSEELRIKLRVLLGDNAVV